MTTRESIANWVAIFTTLVVFEIANEDPIFDMPWVAALFMFVSWFVALGIYSDESDKREQERNARAKVRSNYYELSICKKLPNKYLEKLFLLKSIDELIEHECLEAVFSLEDAKKLLNDKDVKMVIYSVEIFTIDNDDHLRQIKSESLLGDLNYIVTGVFKDKKTNNYLDEDDMIITTKSRALNVLNEYDEDVYVSIVSAPEHSVFITNNN